MTALVFLAALALVGVASGVTAVALKLHAGTVYPFAPSPHTSADTLSAQAGVDTVFAADGWKCVTLSRLRDVEDLLDSLEMHQVSTREVAAIGNSEFRVRWK
jgi:hypothetical protein